MPSPIAFSPQTTKKGWDATFGVDEVGMKKGVQSGSAKDAISG